MARRTGGISNAKPTASVKKPGVSNNAPLKGEPHEIGRARAFTPGWLENESIWLHMEYKYLLGLLKAGLCEAFFEEFRISMSGYYESPLTDVKEKIYLRLLYLFG